ncbi:hypothetical protein B0H11DRAFT_2234031 [Mycena galericulata]|nr:hypothetical protein B0H11DRAFT_2234031 [Mycena galericulata]
MARRLQYLQLRCFRATTVTSRHPLHGIAEPRTLALTRIRVPRDVRSLSSTDLTSHPIDTALRRAVFEILRIHTKNMKFAEDVDLEKTAVVFTDMSQIREKMDLDEATIDAEVLDSFGVAMVNFCFALGTSSLSAQAAAPAYMYRISVPAPAPAPAPH